MNFPIRVYYENTDAGGVVYHAQYLNFFERARTEYLRSLGFSQQKLLAQHVAFVVKHLEIDYKEAARLDDQLIVETKITEIRKASIVFEQFLWKADRCLSLAKVLVATVDLQKMKPIKMPFSIYQALQAV
ncbi:tol-pal system-associated acyl-CoA thioesterase [Vespertiliibacter pulmonis]|uniref:Acyl-CoA thioester hydrolase n=1 Tax=Vespertiliibacter pulmonis TaxID=1443036 RepID=A0A3N4VRP7_9PAST|nr:tol-pal system-associated acyl-CoA thioesterase [Vespertiliibacter pulmonis]QLB21281.1 tol-pal system-associated acyl-CoA thioesterase [Vespertiliibacter pulmonis]RPE85688.1 acyl-CoA thioester hydrolase [Vespertiliibacter pulmonis]